MVAAFWAGIPVEITQDAGVVPRCDRDTHLVASYDTQGNVGRILAPPTGVNDTLITLSISIVSHTSILSTLKQTYI